ncbi:MAG TPA: rhodanese-like domain-containing protein [Blastocatellia bacterium]|nr:rhodanese-like domain-containing protein [Blastocatellia bacterium]
MRAKAVLATTAFAVLFATGMLATAPAVRAHPLAIAPANAMVQEDESAKYEMSAVDVKKHLARGDIELLDVRSELNGEILKGAIHVPVSKIDDWAKTQSKKKLIVSYCTCPHDEAANSATNKLRAMGFTNAFALKGGLNGGRSAGIAVIAPKE